MQVRNKWKRAIDILGGREIHQMTKVYEVLHDIIVQVLWGEMLWFLFPFPCHTQGIQTVGSSFGEFWGERGGMGSKDHGVSHFVEDNFVQFIPS